MFMKENVSLSALMGQKEVVDIVFEFASHHYFSIKVFVIPSVQLIMNQMGHVMHPVLQAYNAAPVATTIIDLFPKSLTIQQYLFVISKRKIYYYQLTKNLSIEIHIKN